MTKRKEHVCGRELIKRCFFVPNLSMNLLIAQELQELSGNRLHVL